MAHSSWHKRIQRAQELVAGNAGTAAILRFYTEVARLQEQLYDANAKGKWALPGAGQMDFLALRSSFSKFFDHLGSHAPAELKRALGQLKAAGAEKWAELLAVCWQGGPDEFDPQVAFVLRAFLQPFAELAREQTPLSLKDYSQPFCPYCGRRPGLAVLRPEGEGAKRSLVCSFCLAEWNFRRIVCPSCGEEDHQKLPVYTAEEFDYIRVEACDTCKHYLKSVDLTKNGRAEPVVDEIAAAPLDLWAREHGYQKIESNLVGM